MYPRFFFLSAMRIIGAKFLAVSGGNPGSTALPIGTGALDLGVGISFGSSRTRSRRTGILRGPQKQTLRTAPGSHSKQKRFKRSL